MKPSLLLTVVASLALSIFLPDAAAKGGKGGNSKKAAPTPAPEKAKAFSEIKSVAGDAITIEHSKTTTTYKMSSETQIQVDGRRVRSTDLKPGMHVEVTPSSINPALLRSVAATTPTKS